MQWLVATLYWCCVHYTLADPNSVVVELKGVRAGKKDDGTGTSGHFARGKSLLDPPTMGVVYFITNYETV
jgi:hypothetical protein